MRMDTGGPAAEELAGRGHSAGRSCVARKATTDFLVDGEVQSIKKPNQRLHRQQKHAKENEALPMSHFRLDPITQISQSMQKAVQIDAL